MGNGQTNQSEVVNEMNSMVANVMVNIALFCNTQNTSSQTISIDCQPQVSDPNSVYEANVACRKCMSDVVQSQLAYYNTQRAAWTNRPASVEKPIDSDYQNVINEFVICTTQHCKACNIQDVSQLNTIKTTLGCNAFNNVQNSVAQKLVSQIDQSLTNNQDMLSPLATMLGASTYSDLVYNIASRMSAVMTENVISNISQTISAEQNMVFSQDASVAIQGLTQQTALTAVQNYLQKTNIMNSVFSDAQWKTLQDLVNEQNTIGTLGNLVTKAVGYLSKMLTNVCGKVTIFVLILVAVVFVGVVLYISTKLIQKELKKQHDKDAALKAQADTVSAFETF